MPKKMSMIDDFRIKIPETYIYPFLEWLLSRNDIKADGITYDYQSEFVYIWLSSSRALPDFSFYQKNNETIYVRTKFGEDINNMWIEQPLKDVKTFFQKYLIPIKLEKLK